MMQFMAGDSECNRPHSHFIIVGDAAPAPGISRKVFEEEHRCAAHRLVFLDDVAQSYVGEVGIRSERILIEAG